MMKAVKTALLAMTAIGMAACSGGAGGGSGGGGSTNTTKSLTVSGSFDSLPALVSNSVFGFVLNPFFVDEYKVRCVTLSGPLHASEGVVSGAENAFSFVMTAGLNAPLGCFLLADDAIAAIFSFASVPTMSGGTANVTSYAPRSDSTTFNLGEITIAGGVATVAAVTENGSADRPTFANMTGTWKMKSYHDDPENNYVHPCDMDFDPETQAEKNAGCKELWETAGIYFNQIEGTNGTDTKFGIGLWESNAHFQGCGSKEGVELDAGWTAVGGWPTTPLTYVGVDLSNIGDTELDRALFYRSEQNGQTNCPKDDDNVTELPGCTTATNCGDFDFTMISDLSTRSMEKARCVINSLTNGGGQGYQYPANQCAARAEVDWEALNLADIDNDGSGCTDSGCDGAVNFEPEHGDPQGRMFFSELFITGNVGSAAKEETDTCEGATYARTISITLTQASSTKATLAVEMSTRFSAGTEQQKEDCLEEEEWLVEEMAGVRRFKMEFEKQ